jgi:hypothetical protein
MHAVALVVVLWFTGGSLPLPADAPSIAGGWVLNKELSDAPAAEAAGGERADGESGRGDGRRGDGSGRRGGGVHGGFGGRGAGRGGGGRGADTRDEIARMRDAMHDMLEPPDHLTIVQTPAMIVITGADGRTTRLAPDGKKVKDENTKVERKTKWDGPRLVSEISGLGPGGKMTQTFAVDPDSHRLRVSVQMEGGRSGQARTITHVYEPELR